MSSANKITIILAGVLVLLPVYSCRKKSSQKVTLSINARPLVVEIASTPKRRARGLMHRETLAPKQGMLFVFEEEKILSFWMKDTKIPLSIAFLDKNGVVVDIKHMQPYSLKPVRSSERCKYAIEANRGFFARAGLSAGDAIDLSMIE